LDPFYGSKNFSRLLNCNAYYYALYYKCNAYYIKQLFEWNFQVSLLLGTYLLQKIKKDNQNIIKKNSSQLQKYYNLCLSMRWTKFSTWKFSIRILFWSIHFNSVLNDQFYIQFSMENYFFKTFDRNDITISTQGVWALAYIVIWYFFW
jgi:hypothetical protein